MPGQTFRLKDAVTGRSVSRAIINRDPGQTHHTHSHVQARARKCSGDGVNQLTRNSEVAELDNALAREKDVRRLDVAVDRLARMQIRQSLQDLSCSHSREVSVVVP